MDSPEMRASDADRAAVTQILEQAVGQGMLTLDEYAERVDVVLAARTRRELDTVIVDLPHVRTQSAPPPPEVLPGKARAARRRRGFCWRDLGVGGRRSPLLHWKRWAGWRRSVC